MGKPTNHIFIIAEENSLLVRAMVVPGGLLMITDSWMESGDGVSTSVSTSFVPMTTTDAITFLEGRE